MATTRLGDGAVRTPPASSVDRGAIALSRARARARALALALALAPPVSASAQDDQEDAFGATARLRAPLAATNPEDATAAGTRIDADGPGRASQEVSEALIEVPGLRVQQRGGAGAGVGALLTLRGAEAGHTAVLFDTIPLTGPDSGPFDLSVVPLSALQAVEVYRGGAPAWYGQGAIGGVLRYVPATAGRDLLQATVGAGSFGRRELRTTAAVTRPQLRGVRFVGHLRALSADNDYAYVDDGGTRHDATDDRTLHQQNADLLQTDALMHGGVDLGGGRLSLLVAGHGRTGGVPGPLAARALRMRRKLVRTLAGAAYTHEAFDPDGERHHRLQLVAAGTQQRNAVSDPFPELGLAGPIAADDLWQRGFVRAAGGVRLLPFLEPTVIATLARDAYRPSDPLAFTNPPRPSDRSTVALTAEPRVYGRLLGMRAELRPSLRAQWSRSEVRAETGLQRIDSVRSQYAPTYRLAAALEPIGGLTFSASVATGKRLPSIGELFGDRAYQEPNPTLRPERATAVDAGAVVRGRRGALRGAVELRGFALRVRDLIRFELTSQHTVLPRNIARGDVLGAELGIGGRYGRHLSLASSLTVMRSENAFGKALPLRPPLQVLARPQLHFFPGFADELTAFGEVHHVAFVYLDEAERTHLPGRTLFSAGASLTLWHARATVDVRVNNLLDLRVTDVLSRPLPGRDYRLSLTLRHD